MTEYKENEIYGNNHDEVFQQLGIPLKGSTFSSMQKYINVNKNGCFFVYFWFPHYLGFSEKKKIIFNNVFENDMFIMKKQSPLVRNPRLWKNSSPRIMFYDDNSELGERPLYKFKGVYQFDHSEKDDSKVYLKKIGSVLLIDEKTKAVSWK